MIASKENARKAIKQLATVAKALHLDFNDEILFVRDFLKAAEKRLPTEAAINRETKMHEDAAAEAATSDS